MRANTEHAGTQEQYGTLARVPAGTQTLEAACRRPGVCVWREVWGEAWEMVCGEVWRDVWGEAWGDAWVREVGVREAAHPQRSRKCLLILKHFY